MIIVREMDSTKSSFLFSMKYAITSTVEELQTWLKLLEKLEILFKISVRMQKMTENSNRLLITQEYIDDYIQENLFLVASTDQEAFFGRTCAFQFCDSLKTPLTGCAVALASYNDGYEAFQESALGATAKSIFSGTRYMLNPELRAQKMSEIMKNANVEFCKAFWQLTETSIAQVLNILVFRIIGIITEPIYVQQI
jgi:hormone-sensitive lipase